MAATLAIAKSAVDLLVAQQGAYAAAQALGLDAICPTGQTCPQCKQTTVLCDCPPGYSQSGEDQCCDPQSGVCFVRSSHVEQTSNCKGGAVGPATCVPPAPGTCKPWQVKDQLGNCVTNPCSQGQYRDTEAPYGCVPNPCCH